MLCQSLPVLKACFTERINILLPILEVGDDSITKHDGSDFDFEPVTPIETALTHYV